MIVLNLIGIFVVFTDAVMSCMIRSIIVLVIEVTRIDLFHPFGMIVHFSLSKVIYSLFNTFIEVFYSSFATTLMLYPDFGYITIELTWLIVLFLHRHLMFAST